MKAARRGAVPCKATGAELPNAKGVHLLHQHDLDVTNGVKGDNLGVLRFDCLTGLWTHIGPVVPVFWTISPFWNECIYPMLMSPLYL